MNDLTVWLVAAAVVPTGLVVMFWCVKRYDLAVFLTALSPALSAAFVSTNPEGVDEAGLGSYLRLAVLFAMGAVGLVQFARMNFRRTVRIPTHYKLLGVFLIFAAASTFYSIDQKYTLARSASLMAVFAFLFGLHFWLQNQQRLDQAFHMLFCGIAFATLICLLMPVFLPGQAWNAEVDNRFQGFWSHPNTMGSFCMLSYPVLLWKFPRGGGFTKTAVIALLATLLGLHVLTGSRGSLLAAALGMCVWFAVLKKRAQLVLMLGMIMIGGALLAQLQPESFKREGVQAAVTDLTGRNEFWLACFQLIKERPLQGYGYGVEGKVWTDPRFNKPEYALWSGSARTSLHNGYVSVAVGVGVIGFMIWCLVLFIPLWRYRRSPRSDDKALVMAIMSMCLILNFVETEIAAGNSICGMFFWIAWALTGKLALPGRDMPLNANLDNQAQQSMVKTA